MDIKPIETEYNGYRFRSRLEARWAVFFDAMGIKYEYEPEGFELENGIKYLPDFRIYVKHRPHADDDEWALCHPLLMPYDEDEPVYVEVKGKMTPADLEKIESFPCPILVLGNVPADSDEYEADWYESNGEYNSFCYMDGDKWPAAFSIYEGSPWICGPGHGEWDCGRSMDKALAKARQARFEHGEKPNVPGCQSPTAPVLEAILKILQIMKKIRELMEDEKELFEYLVDMESDGYGRA